jgi:hypothetical protein
MHPHKANDIRRIAPHPPQAQPLAILRQLQFELPHIGSVPVPHLVRTILTVGVPHALGLERFRTKATGMLSAPSVPNGISARVTTMLRTHQGPAISRHPTMQAAFGNSRPFMPLDADSLGTNNATGSHSTKMLRVAMSTPRVTPRPTARLSVQPFFCVTQPEPRKQRHHQRRHGFRHELLGVHRQDLRFATPEWRQNGAGRPAMPAATTAATVTAPAMSAHSDDAPCRKASIGQRVHQSHQDRHRGGRYVVG